MPTQQKAIIFDASTLINFSMNGLLDVLAELKEIFNGKFLITETVAYETIKRPLGIKKFELGALRINNLLEKKILELPSSLNISNSQIEDKAKELLKVANFTFIARDSYIHIIDIGEASCLALSIIANEKGIKNIIAIDERTTRMLSEKPENLYKLFEKKLHTKVKFFRENIPKLNNLKFIRSSEIVYVAWKKKLIHIKDENTKVLDALLYATKFKGASISRDEIEEMKRL